MNSKFFEEFTKASKGCFPELKFNGATYRKDSRELEIRFIINTFARSNFDAEKEAAVLKVCEEMFDGVKVSVRYIKTYADNNVVKNKVLEYLNANNQLIFRKLTDKTIDIEVSEGNIDVAFNFDAATIAMLTSGNFTEKLKDFLDINFNENISVRLNEIEDTEDIGRDHSSSIVVRHDSLRLVGVKVGEKLYARGKVEGINQMPGYIVDIKAEGENIILCGKVSGVARSTYRNKKYDPNNKKSDPEFKPLVRFILNDTTADIEAVCFPSVEEAEGLDPLKDGDEVICLGRVGTSARGGLSYMLNAVFRCEIDFSSIKTHESKPLPDHYTTISPSPYTGMAEQNSLFDIADSASDKFFKGRSFVVFDLETTSKYPAEARIIEIAAIKVVDGAEREVFHTLVNPEMPIPEDAGSVNHITDEMVANAPKIENVIGDFLRFSYGAVFAGHNIDEYDCRILRRVAMDNGYYFDNATLDTLTLARKVLPGRGLGGYKLETLAKDFHLQHTDAHRALSDVEANLALLRLLVRSNGQ